jgi:cytochrome c-type biogenesis protein CcmH
VGLVAILVAVLVIGTHRNNHASVQAKTMHIAGLVRCPVCEGQSAAESDAPASVQIRNQIQQEVTAGENQGQILAGLVAAYGPGILEKPEARGVGLVVWVVPVVAVVAAIAGLALAFRRWRPRRATEVSPVDRALVNEALQGEGNRAAGDGDENGGSEGG